MAYDGTLLFDTKVDTSGFEDGTKQIGNKADSAYKKTSKVLMGVSGAVTAIGTAAVKTTADFDSQMSKVAAISGATGGDFQKLRDKAREMGSKTKFSATESAEALEYMAMAGWKTDDMLSGLEGIMYLAAAAGEDLGTTSDIVTDALTAFGLTAGDSGHFADVLAAASSNANTNVSMLGESFKFVAPVAGSLGMSAEDVAVALGLMANSGIKGSMAGTALRSTLTRLAKPTKQSQTAMDKLGISLTDSNGKIKSLSQIMGEMRTAFSHCTEAEKAQYAAMLAGQEGMSGLLAIVNASEGDYNKLTAAISGCDGVSENMANTMNDNLQGQLTILISALQELAISVGDVLVPQIRKITDFIQKLVDKFNALPPSTKETIVKIGEVVAVAGPAVTIAGKLGSAIGGIATGAKVLGPVLAGAGAGIKGAGAAIVGALGPIGLIIVAIGALVGVFILLWNKCEGFRNFWINLFNIVKGAVMTAVEAVGGFIGKIVEFVQSIPEKIAELPGMIAEFFSNLIQNIGQFIGNIGQTIWNFLKNLPYNLGYALGQGLGRMIKFGADAIAWVRTNVPKIIAAIIEFFKQLPGKIGSWLLKALQNIAQFGVNMAKKAREIGSNFLNAVIKFFRELPGKIWNWLLRTISNIGKFGANMGKKAREAASNFFHGIVDTVKNLPERMMQIGADIVNGVWTGIQNMAKGFWDNVTGFFGGIVDGIKDTLGIASPSKVFASEVGQWIPAGVESGISKAMPGLLASTRRQMESITDAMHVAVNAQAGQISFAKTGAQEYQAALAERLNQHSVSVTGRLESDRPIEVHSELYLDKRKFAREVTPAINHEMYRIDKAENNRGRGN